MSLPDLIQGTSDIFVHQLTYLVPSHDFLEKNFFFHFKTVEKAQKKKQFYLERDRNSNKHKAG